MYIFKNPQKANLVPFGDFTVILNLSSLLYVLSTLYRFINTPYQYSTSVNSSISGSPSPIAPRAGRILVKCSLAL